MFSKKLVSTLILVTGLVVVSQSARGESTTYVGVNVAKLGYSEDVSALGFTASKASTTAFYGRVGTQFHENFAVEFRAGSGESFRPYVIAGFARFKYKASNARLTSGNTRTPLATSESSDTDVSYGIGADIKITDGFGINVEYMNHYGKGTTEIDGTALGLVWSF